MNGAAGVLVLAALGLGGAGGCTASLTPKVSVGPEAGEPGAEIATRVPADITRYPQATYGGRTYYLVDGRWNYRSPDEGWMGLREEPRELGRRRAEIGGERAPTEVEIDGYAAERAPAVPENLERYPHWRFRDSQAYLIDGRWYFASDQGWVIFREEPPELREYRMELKRQLGGPEYGYPGGGGSQPR